MLSKAKAQIPLSTKSETLRRECTELLSELIPWGGGPERVLRYVQQVFVIISAVQCEIQNIIRQKGEQIWARSKWENLLKESINIIKQIIMNRASFDKNGVKLFKITSKKSGKELGISTDPETMGVVILREPSEDLSNVFSIEYQHSHHVIRSQLNLQILTVCGASKEPGALIVTLPDYKSTCQKFFLKRMYRQNEYIIATSNGMVLDCFEQGTDEGTIINQWPQSGKPHQLWIIQQL